MHVVFFFSIQGYLRLALQDRMKYLRSAGKAPKRPLGDNGGECSNDVEPTPKKPKKEYKQFPQLSSEPVIPSGEDESSNSRNHKMILMEEKKTNPNVKTISVLMMRTFAFRRRDILSNPKPLKEIVKAFPSLKRLDQV